MDSKKPLNKKKKKTKEIGNFIYDFIKVTGVGPAMIWMRPKRIYYGGKSDLKGGYMISANHSSFLDPIIVHCAFWKRRIYSLATKDLYRSKLHTWFFEHVHCIQVDKDNFSLNSFHQVTKLLKSGKVVCIFPEGEVRPGEKEVLKFKSGIILMAYSAKAPIVPVYFVPLERWYQRRVAVIGQPIDVHELCGIMPTEDDLNRAGEYVHQKEQELKDFYYNEICSGKTQKKNKKQSEATK